MVFLHYHFLTYITKTQPPTPKKINNTPTNQPNKQTNQKQCLKKVENYKIFYLISEKGTLFFLLFISEIVNIFNFVWYY